MMKRMLPTHQSLRKPPSEPAMPPNAVRGADEVAPTCGTGIFRSIVTELLTPLPHNSLTWRSVHPLVFSKKHLCEL